MLVVGHYRFICTSLIPPYLGINIHVSIKENNCDKAEGLSMEGKDITFYKLVTSVVTQSQSSRFLQKIFVKMLFFFIGLWDSQINKPSDYRTIVLSDFTDRRTIRTSYHSYGPLNLTNVHT